MLLNIQQHTGQAPPLSIKKNDLEQNGNRVDLNRWFSDCPVHQGCLESLLQPTFLGPIPRISDSVGLGKDPRTRISDSFPSDADSAALETLACIISIFIFKLKISELYEFFFFHLHKILNGKLLSLYLCHLPKRPRQLKKCVEVSQLYNFKSKLSVCCPKF